MTEAQYLQDRRTRVKMAVDQLCNVLDSFSSQRTDQMFIEALVANHRTLQQNFWRTMAGVIRKYAKVEYDDRNEASVQMCERLAEVIEEEGLHHLPMI